MHTYRSFQTLVTPQSEPISGSNQVANNAGGYAFPVDDWTRLERFLILGSESGTYYVGEREFTKQNAQAVMRCISVDGMRVLRTVAEISTTGRAPKNEPALFTLALAISFGDAATKATTSDVLQNVARTGTHLLHFVAYARQFRGWGRALKNAVRDWYLSKPSGELAYQVVKYQSRDKWSHRDLLRLTHPKAHTAGNLNDVLYWTVKGWPDIGPDAPESDAIKLIWAFEAAKRATNAREVVKLIEEFGLTREMVPTEMLNDPGVWMALLNAMPMTAMIRNLATMTRVGTLAQMSAGTALVVDRLSNVEVLQRSRIHPVQLLAALKTYSQGRGERSKNTWVPIQRIVDALDSAFYVSFGNVPATGKRFLIGLDVSGSMDWTQVNGVPNLTCHDAQATMALVTATVEPNHAFVAFDTQGYAPAISPRMRLDNVVSAIKAYGGGGTDCSIPIRAATELSHPVDVFVIYTDNETWAGNIHPVQALTQYRQKTGINAKLAVVAMASNHVSIAADDAGMLNVVGFDTNAPALIGDFAK